MTSKEIDAYIEQHGSDVIHLIDYIEIQDIIFGCETDEDTIQRLDAEIASCRNFMNEMNQISKDNKN